MFERFSNKHFAAFKRASSLFCGMFLRTSLPILLFILGSVTSLYGQDSLRQLRKVTTAVRITGQVKVDGVLDEAVWQGVPVAMDFTEVEPVENIPAKQRTEVKVIYDNEAVYIGAYCYDTHPDSILTALSLRDQEGANADIFGVSFDTYFDQQNLYIFEVTAAGVQSDERLNIEGYNAIWENASRKTSDGWIAELKIPYAAFRFPDKDIQKWGLQFRRYVRRTRSNTFWQYVPNTVQNYPAYIGILEGVSQIKPPVRLFLTPYIGLTASHFPSNVAGQSNWSRGYNAGLDLKYGINESFTLDMTLAPDFGQVQSDNKVLNLSAFEVEFAERRPFFSEGVDLFDQEGLFYSRRIGQTPSGYSSVEADTAYTVVDNPERANLLNAFKVTGRTSNGLGMGVLNAITDRAVAIVTDSSGVRRELQTEPLINYNAVAINKTLPNNSYLNFINTNVLRTGNANTSNVTGAGFRAGNKAGRYTLQGFTAISQQYNGGLIDHGYQYNLAFNKISGNFQFELSRSVLSNTYDCNDFGFLLYNNEIKHEAVLNYNVFKPYWGIAQRSFTTLSTSYSNIYQTGAFQALELNFNHFMIAPSFNSYYVFANTKPVENTDIYEARTPGRIYKGPAYGGGGVGVSSDYRKALALDASIGYFADYKRRGKFYELKFSPRIRVNDKLMIIHSFNVAFDQGNQGYAATRSDTIYFSRRNVHTWRNETNISYIFSPKSAITLRMRHYFSSLRVKYFELLQQDGSLLVDTTGFASNLHRQRNYFNIDFVYTWRFAPGSDLLLIWKNAIDPAANYVSAPASDLDLPYGRQFYRTIRSEQSNTFNVKLVYYLDYRYLVRKNR